jgi:LmbE family N-acetylglucosaminyl deacetylase
VVILCLTRGEGGQNVIGPELGKELAEVRTREFHRVVEGYGAEVRFMGAEDFGYSKSLDETLRIWDENTMIAALVREIRRLRPLTVISNWTGTASDGSAHHHAAGLLARHAFGLAGEPMAFPEHFEEGLEPWQPRYFLVRRWSLEGDEETTAFEVPVELPSPIAGKTYSELGWDAFRNHRSQGMHLIQFPRRWKHYLQVVATLRSGPPTPTDTAELSPLLVALPEFFPSVEVLAAWRGRLADVVGLADEADQKRRAGKPGEAALALVQGAGLLAALRREIPEETTQPEGRFVRALLDDRENEFLQAAADLAGIRFEAFTDRAPITPGEQVWVGLSVRLTDPGVFAHTGFRFGTLRLDTPIGWRVEPLEAETGDETQRAEFLVSIPENLDPRLAPEFPLRAYAALTTGSLQVELDSVVHGLAGPPPEVGGLLKRLDPRRLLQREETQEAPQDGLAPVRLAPAVTLHPTPRLRLLAAGEPEVEHEWCVELEAHRPQIGRTSAWFEVPMGWFTPLPRAADLEQPGERTRLCMPITLPKEIPPGRYHFDARAGRDVSTYTLARIPRFQGTPDATFLHDRARVSLQALDVNVPAGLRVGYIGFNDDPVPGLLAQVGVAVDLLDERALARNQLSDYDAIVVATRSYDYRDDLGEATPRLLDYVAAGGTLLVEHQGRRWDPKKFAPYPAEHSSRPTLRVTTEIAPVKMLAPEHSVLSFPNRITEADWRGWVQERGLYFWKSWPGEYTALLEMADPGQEPLRGSLLAARYGEGTYIYCGLALFRQIRAGIPGGIRLYVNLLSQGRRPQKEALPAEGSVKEPETNPPL